jgi:hypothetical protein
MKLILSILLIFIFSFSSIVATAKTLPKKVFKIDIHSSNYEIENLGANPSGDKVTWEKVKLDEGTVEDVYLVGTYIHDTLLNDHGIDIAENTIIANSWKKSMLFFDLAYGLTDKLTIFTNISYENAMLDYTDEYVAISEIINTSAVGEATGYNAVPNKAEANHLNDTFVGFKYALKNFSLAYKGTWGFLKTGHDSTEKEMSDGVQELETSRGYDQHHILAFYDLEMVKIPIELTAGYIYLGEMTQNFLDNRNIKFKPGNMVVGKINLPFQLTKKIKLSTSLTGIIHGEDEYKDGNSAFSNTDPAATRNSGYADYTTVPDSDGEVLIGKVELSYQPKRYIRGFVNGTFVIDNTISGVLYNFPGRLEPGNMIGFGVTLFAKH